MSGLFSILTNSGQALGTYALAMSTVQQNLANASTPGYARQEAILVDLAFRPADGRSGGVRFAGLKDSRDPTLDQTIRFQNSLSQRWLTAADSLQQIAANLAGLSTTLDSLFTLAQTYSSETPTADTRTLLLNQARLVASTVNDTARGIKSLRDGVNSQARFAVANINRLSESIATHQSSDAVSQAGLDSLLQELSDLVDITVSRDEDGRLNVFLGGQVALVSGGRAYGVSASPQTTDGTIKLLDSFGRDVSGNVSDGKLGAYLGLVNKTFPAILGDKSSVGNLNILVKNLADQANEALGDPGFFIYDPDSPTTVAESLKVNPSLTSETFRPSMAGIHKLAGLASPTAGGAELGGLGFVSYFELIVSQQVMDSSSARSAWDRHTALLDQAETLRSKISGVDLPTQAVELLQIQQSFQAITKVMSTVNELIDSVLNLVR